MPHITIRPMDTRDQPEVAALILGGLAEHWGDVNPSLNPDVHDLLDSYPGGRTVVAIRLDRVVGTGTVIAVGDGPAEIRRMSVDPACRHRGVGRRILDDLVATARSWPVDRVVLETSAHWHDVVAFYLSCGFVITHDDDGAFGRDTWFALDL